LGILILAIFIGLPVIEIAVLIEVGGRIGLWATIAAIIGTAIAGSFLLRWQGLAVLARARRELQSGKPPVRELLDGACLLVAGCLLLTPGFVTDGLGALLLIPPVRTILQIWLVRFIAKRAKIQVQTGGRTHHRRPGREAGSGSGIIDGEYTVVQDAPDAPNSEETPPLIDKRR